MLQKVFDHPFSYKKKLTSSKKNYDNCLKNSNFFGKMTQFWNDRKLEIQQFFRWHITFKVEKTASAKITWPINLKTIAWYVLNRICQNSSI